MPSHTLKKDERLHGKNDISTLLAKGRSGDEQFIKYRYLRNTGDGHNRIMVSVSKRLFKRAVKRNLLKRRIRESYRLMKQMLPEEGGTDILFIYNTKEIRTFRDISEVMENILKKVGGHGQRQA